jgi:hypothetical protein
MMPSRPRPASPGADVLAWTEAYDTAQTNGIPNRRPPWPDVITLVTLVSGAPELRAEASPRCGDVEVHRLVSAGVEAEAGSQARCDRWPAGA